jgi:hypothetical protein
LEAHGPAIEKPPLPTNEYTFAIHPLLPGSLALRAKVVAVAEMAMKLAVLFAIALTGVGGVPLESFYPFGPDAGDEPFIQYDNDSLIEIPDSSPPITLSIPFVFFGVEQDILFVSVCMRA